MTIHYVDFEGGNDGNTGLSFAQRKKTLSAVTPVAGDDVRLMASPLQTSLGSATWTNLSKTVIVPSGLTANIDLGEVAWTPAANVTATTSVTRKEGALASSLAIGAAFTTGLVAYRAFSATDFSAFQQISFWLRTNLAFLAGVFELRLCSDAAGVTAVNTVPIIGIPNLNLFTAITYDFGVALGASIQSVAIYALSDPGTITLIIDNILACKASSAADSITLHSLLGKNVAGETWYSIQSINGTTVLLDNAANDLATAGRGYFGATETVTTYKREPQVPALGAGVANSPLIIQASGAIGTPINISGGWNRTDMSTQVDETWITGSNIGINGMQLANRSFINVSKINIVRYAVNLSMSGTSSHDTFTDCAFNNATTGLSTIATNFKCVFTNIYANNCNANLAISSVDGKFTNITSNNNITRGLVLGGANNVIRGLYLGNNANEALQHAAGCKNIIYDLVTSNSVANVGVLNSGYELHLIRPLISEGTKVNSTSIFSDYKVLVFEEGATLDNHKVYTYGGSIAAELGVNRRTASGIAWALSPNTTNAFDASPLRLKEPTMAVKVDAGSLVTMSVWVKRTNTGVTARLVVPGGQIDGVPADVVASASGPAGTYEQITLTFTPSVYGVVEFEFQAYGGTTFTAYFDDMVISQA